MIIIYTLFYYLGIVAFFIGFYRKKDLAITYHNIIPDSLFDDHTHLGVFCSQSVFQKQVQTINKKTKGMKNKGVLITFDYSYKNQIEIAAKILNEYKQPAIFFISFKHI